MAAGTKQNVVIIGCGNVAWHIAKKLSANKNIQLEVFNHQPNPELARMRKIFKCETHDSLNNISETADYYFICVNDRSIKSTATALRIKNPRAVLIHTSGSVPLSDLGERMHGTAVVYPLQSFTKNEDPHWQELSLIVNASGVEVLKNLEKFLTILSPNIVPIDEQQLLRLHLAAVIVNNFVNALYTTASELLSSAKQKEHFRLLIPLIKHTCEKVSGLDPRSVQTGPAKRRDKAVMKKHLQLLKKNKDAEKMYKMMSKLIIKQDNS